MLRKLKKKNPMSRSPRGCKRWKQARYILKLRFCQTFVVQAEHSEVLNILCFCLFTEYLEYSTNIQYFRIFSLNEKSLLMPWKLLNLKLAWGCIPATNLNIILVFVSDSIFTPDDDYTYSIYLVHKYYHVYWLLHRNIAGHIEIIAIIKPL